MSYERLFLLALGFTVAVETFVLLLLRAWLRKSWTRLAGAGVFASGLTLPYVWFVLPALLGTGTAYAAGAETFAVLVEAVFLAAFLGLGTGKALGVSVLCNAASWLTGRLVF